MTAAQSPTGGGRLLAWSLFAIPAVSLLALASLAISQGVPTSEAAVCLAVASVLAWQLRQRPIAGEPAPWPTRRLGLAAIGLGVGAVIGSWLLVAVGWMHLARAALTRHFDDDQRDAIRPWWPVALMAVPWIWADGWWLGWQMRWTAAATVAAMLDPFLSDLSRQGTSLLANGIRIEVSAGCAGLGLLQAMLMLGLAGTAFVTRSTWKTVAAIPALIVLAWLANVARVAILTLVAVFGSAELASHTLHDFSGYALLAVIAWTGWTVHDRLQSSRKTGTATAATE